MPEINSKPVKKEELEDADSNDDRSTAIKKKRPNTATKSQLKVKKEEADESFEEPKAADKVLQKMNAKEKKEGKGKEAVDDKKRVKKLYDFPGQKRDPPEERDPLRIFYETLFKQVPASEMAAIWMMESGLLPKEEAKRVFERRQKQTQQQKLSSPMKTAVTVKKESDSVTILKKSSTTPVSKQKRKTRT